MVTTHEGNDESIGANLHFRSYGEGPPLVVLHGFLGAGGNWHTLASRAFGEHFTTYAIDQRNHGKSPHSDEMNFGVLADDLRDFLDAHSIDRCHVLGHSMGGKVAMQFALHYPERTNKLVVVDIAPRPYAPAHLTILEALQSATPEEASSRSDVDAQIAALIKEAPVRQFLLKNLGYDRDAKKYFWEMNLEALAAEYTHLNAGIAGPKPFEGPALFVHGEGSDYVQPDDEPMIRSLFPSAQTVMIPGAGHWVHADAPEAFAKTALEFLLD